MPDEKLAERAVFSLGANANTVRISNTSHEGVRTNFTATVGGRSSQCYVTGAGAHVSDAICFGPDARAGAAGAERGGACNALLRSAGRC